MLAKMQIYVKHVTFVKEQELSNRGIDHIIQQYQWTIPQCEVYL